MSSIKGWAYIDNVPEEPCEYKLFEGDELIRNGSSCNCKRRLKEHRRRIPEASGFRVQLTDNCKAARVREKTECEVNKPRLNKRCG